MRVTNEQLEDIKNGENYGIECDEVNDTNIHAIVFDLLESRVLINETRKVLTNIKCQPWFDVSERNQTSIKDILEKIREYYPEADA